MDLRIWSRLIFQVSLTLIYIPDIVNLNRREHVDVSLRFDTLLRSKKLEVTCFFQKNQQTLCHMLHYDGVRTNTRQVSSQISHCVIEVQTSAFLAVERFDVCRGTIWMSKILVRTSHCTSGRA